MSLVRNFDRNNTIDVIDCIKLISLASLRLRRSIAAKDNAQVPVHWPWRASPFRSLEAVGEHGHDDPAPGLPVEMRPLHVSNKPLLNLLFRQKEQRRSQAEGERVSVRGAK